MTKDVLVRICSTQSLGDQQDDGVEVISPGMYYFRNGHHYILYEEPVEGEKEKIKNRIKIGKGFLEVTKSGITNVHMYFKENERTISNYGTPCGSLLIDFDTKEICVQEEDQKMEIEVSYGMELDGEHLADFKLKIGVYSKIEGNFKL